LTTLALHSFLPHPGSSKVNQYMVIPPINALARAQQKLCLTETPVAATRGRNNIYSAGRRIDPAVLSQF
jgi:hypothetical protein